ncbi:MAG: VOC family protein [Actinobacteria bacterium]|nr:VOC family protein [Actinomycetota bacterium]MBE3113928.1 VOC family protein [Actinomycetota bacterium]
MSHSKLGCVYISVKDINKSIEFYGFLLQKEVEVSFKDRWAQFKINDDFRLGLLNPAFDKKIIKDRQDLDEHFDKNYIKNFSSKVRVGNSIILNLQTDDLNVEHRRLSTKYKDEVSEIMYINFMFPYYFFMVRDPDGNLIEIAGA